MVGVFGNEGGGDADEGENRNSAASPKHCKDMKKKYGSNFTESKMRSPSTTSNQ